MRFVFVFCLIFIASGDCYKDLIVSREDYVLEPITCIIKESKTDVTNIENVKIYSKFEADCNTIGITGISTDYIPIVLKSARPFKDFSLEQVENSSIREETFEGGDFEIIELEWIVQSSIADYTFRKVKNLTKIVWNFSEIEIISKFAFSGVENLTYINIGANEISKIEAGTFNISTLTDLFLFGNKLKSIEDRTFEGAVNLRILDLDDNEIEKISENGLFGLENLHYLDMENNKIKILDPQIFKHTPHLCTLDLSRNQLSTLDESTFLLAKELEMIEVSWNRINEISRKTFDDLTNLQSLGLLENVCVDKTYEEMPARDILNGNLQSCYENYEKMLQVN